MSAPYDVRTAECIGDFRLRVGFADGTEGEIDFSARLTDAGQIFVPLRDLTYFKQVAVDAEIGTITWPNGADFAPHVLYDEVRGSHFAAT